MNLIFYVIYFNANVFIELRNSLSANIKIPIASEKLQNYYKCKGLPCTYDSKICEAQRFFSKPSFASEICTAVLSNTLNKNICRRNNCYR